MTRLYGLKTYITLILLLCFPASLLAFEVHYYETDALGTPITMVDVDGNRVWRAVYFPFGEERAIQETPESNDRRFIGKEKDKETGLTYFEARYMEANTGRFLSPDPVGPVDAFTGETNYVLLTQPQRLNRYAYGLNNPYRYVDPDGRDPKDHRTGETNEVTRCHAETHNDPQKELLGVSIMATAASGAAVEAVAGRIVSGVVGRFAAEGTTNLFRAVSESEFKQIQKTGTFEAGPNSLGGKFFAESVEDAKKWGDVLNGSGNSRIVGAEMPKGVADSLQRWGRLDGIGPARYGELDQLKNVKIKEVP